MPGPFARLAQGLSLGKITNAFAAAQPSLFYLLSPEAAHMTVYLHDQHSV
jgi:hypothetical protein